MAIRYSNLVPTEKSLFSFVVLTFTTLLWLSESAKAISFNFTKFAPDEGLILQGEAEILTNGILALTPVENATTKIGRALYITPLTIWDETNGNLASFVTSLSFKVEGSEKYRPSDGIIFFLVSPDSKIPSNSNAAYLGVADCKRASNRFVGVEFDSYTNEWDPVPASPHIGINANSLISLNTVKWKRENGSLVNVTIRYDSLSKNLSVNMTNKDGTFSTVSQVINLKAFLPAKVRVGLSATSGNPVEMHNIHSWYFSSTWETTTAPITTTNIVNTTSSKDPNCCCCNNHVELTTPNVSSPSKPNVVGCGSKPPSNGLTTSPPQTNNVVGCGFQTPTIGVTTSPPQTNLVGCGSSQTPNVVVTSCGSKAPNPPPQPDVVGCGPVENNMITCY